MEMVPEVQTGPTPKHGGRKRKVDVKNVGLNVGYGLCVDYPLFRLWKTMGRYVDCGRLWVYSVRRLLYHGSVCRLLFVDHRGLWICM